MSMLHPHKKLITVSAAAGSLIFLAGCGSAPDCGSSDTKKTVVEIAQENKNNRLINYAVSRSEVLKQKVEQTASAKSLYGANARINEIDHMIESIKGEWNRRQNARNAEFGAGFNRNLGKIWNPVEKEEMLTRQNREWEADRKYYPAKLEPFEKEKRDLDGKRESWTTKKNEEQSNIFAKAKESASYSLDTIRTDSKNAETRSVTCSAILRVAVEGQTSQLDINYKVDQTSDGGLYVTVYGL